MFKTVGHKVINKYPLWKYLVLIMVVVWGFLYALPNLYGENPAIQVTGNAAGVLINPAFQKKVEQLLQQAHIPYLSTKLTANFLQLSLPNSNAQLKAQTALKNALGDDYTIALSLAPATPAWLQAINAQPMKLGLDLRGGVHLLLDIDIKGFLAQRANGDKKGMGEELRSAHIRYSGVRMQANNVIVLQFHDAATLNAAAANLPRHFADYTFVKNTDNQQFTLTATPTPQSLVTVNDYVIDQTMSTLHNRVDELGVSNAVVQRQGATRVSVDLPGVLDAARAKQILGGTATLEFHLMDETHDPANYLNGQAPLGSKMYYYNKTPILLQSEIVLQGSSITGANASFGEDGRPSVNIRLGGGGEAFFSRVTRENVGKHLAIVYVETKPVTTMVDGKEVRTHRKVEKVISNAVIQSALGNNFQITGLDDPQEASNLALYLRAGALPAAMDIAQERTVGPTLGKENIYHGLLSVAIGFGIVVLFMAFYYQVFGLIADLALLMNLVLLAAILSVLGMVLTLPGIAGFVLTVGIAVDANVLIFERIREELRNGVSPQASIHAGYERAFNTIVDANVTTLIAALALFGVGTGPIKGFAITLIIGLLTSMVTAITGTRAIVNLIYGGRQVKWLSIGISEKKG